MPLTTNCQNTLAGLCMFLDVRIHSEIAVPPAGGCVGANIVLAGPHMIGNQVG